MIVLEKEEMILNGKIININESPFFIDSLSLDFNDLLSFCAFVELHQKYPSVDLIISISHE